MLLWFFMAREMQTEAGEICSSYERQYLPVKLFPGRSTVEVSSDNSDQEVP